MVYLRVAAAVCAAAVSLAPSLHRSTSGVAATVSTEWRATVHGSLDFSLPARREPIAESRMEAGMSLAPHHLGRVSGKVYASTTNEEEAKGTDPGLTEAEGPKIRLGFPGAQHTTTEELWFNTSNEYPPIIQKAWPHVAEPFRETTFAASSRVGDPDKDVFKWSFADGTVLEGREVKRTFTDVGKQTVSLAHIIVSTGNTQQIESYVMVKYVRREIRQLTDKDREAFLDALEKLYRLPTSEGVRLYGSGYKGINFFVQMHLDGAGVTDCDHWHDDAGIMTHHVGYTLEFEQALQVVDPSVTIPYWEYTIESAAGLTSYGDSPIFQDDWLGEASPDNDFHTVDKGRWAFLPVMRDAWEYVHNSYGLLRTPWNTDPTPYVTRHNLTNGEERTSMVTCSSYLSCFESDSIASMNNCLNGGTHGPVHIKVGGEWNSPEENLVGALGYPDAVPLMAKFLWRKGYLRLPDTCTAAEDGIGDDSTCRASCPAEIYESLGMTAYDVLMDTLALHWIANRSGGILVRDEYTGDFTVAGHEDDEDFKDALWRRILGSLCDPGHVGDMYTSSAPYDPLFWLIHPTADRLLGWRRKLAKEYPDQWAFNETWDYSRGSVIGETGVVCNWDDAREGTYDMPTCTKGICGGHNADDLLPFKIKLKGKTVQLTNTEWYDLIYPENDDLPYMYNEFSWEHCAADGISFEANSRY